MDHRISRRTALGGLAALAVGAGGASTLTGCATAVQHGSTDSRRGDGPVTLRFQCLAFADATIKATQAIVSAWNDQHPDVTVDYIQGSWDSVQDQLVTQFMGGIAPDIIQYESAEMVQFAQQNYLVDLAPHLSAEVRQGVPEAVWKTVTVDDKIIATPTLLQSYLVFANVGMLRQAGVSVPTGDTWSWDDFTAAAKATTGSGVHGLGWGLASPTATMMSMGQAFGATYFSGAGQDVQINVGAPELALPERIHQMAYEDKSLDPVSLTQDGGAVMTGFLKGRYAMTVQGSYNGQTLSEEAPKDFEWAVLPILADQSADQSANPQTLSVSALSEDVADAAAFVDFYMRAQNLAKVAEGDWLIPASRDASDVVLADTGGENGWSTVLASGEHLVEAPYQTVEAFPQWKDQIAEPAFQRYLGDEISSADLAQLLTDGWKSVS